MTGGEFELAAAVFAVSEFEHTKGSRFSRIVRSRAALRSTQ
jgi:hypothetical protein